MSTMTTTRGAFGHGSSTAKGGAGFSAIVKSMVSAMAARRATRELAALSDHQLADIGLSRADLPVRADFAQERARIEIRCGTTF